VLFKLEVSEDGFWVSLGALATRTMCFLNCSFLVLPHTADILKKTQLEFKFRNLILFRIVAGSELWLF